MQEVMTFTCQGDQLLGIVEYPAEGSQSAGVAVVIVVGGPQYRVGSHRQFALMSRSLARNGYPCLRFDYRGMGDSDGDPRTFEDVGADVESAVEAMSSRFPGHQIVLLGLCDGASAIALYAGQTKRTVAGAVLLNPWVRSEESLARSYTQHYYRSRLVSRDFWSKLLRGRIGVFQSVKEFLANRKTARQGGSPVTYSFQEEMLRGLESQQWPILCVLSGSDLTAREFEDHIARDVRWARRLSAAGCAQVTVEGADHTLSESEHLDACMNGILDWLCELRRAEEVRPMGQAAPCP